MDLKLIFHNLKEFCCQNEAKEFLVKMNFHQWLLSPTASIQLEKMSKTILNLNILTGILGLFLIVSQPVAFGEEGLFLDFPIGLKIGETVNIDSNLKITLLDIQDSRCPSDVVCVWEGTVSAKIQLEKGTQELGVNTISMETIENNEKVFDGYYIRLTNVEPHQFQQKNMF